jgi:hypothetical protein
MPANSVYAGILYQTGGAYANTWDMTVGNSTGIFAGNLYADLANVQTQNTCWERSAVINYPYARYRPTWMKTVYTKLSFQNHNQGANASC